MQRTLFDPAKNNSLVAAKFVLKMRQGRKVFWNLSKTSERLPNFPRLAHILLKRSRSRTFIKKVYRAKIRERIVKKSRNSRKRITELKD